MCAALSAQEHGAERILVVERSKEEERGGNSRFTAGAFRITYDGLDDLLKVMPDLTEEEIQNTDFGSYSAEQFFDDMARVTHYRADPDLVEVLVGSSLESVIWMKDKGVKFLPAYGRQAFRIEGKFKFWGGLTIESSGGGVGLVESLHAAAAQGGIEVIYESRAVSLLMSDGVVAGVEITQHGKPKRVGARAVILASGGFQANTEWRTRYLGPGWDLARVRGTRHNTGDGIRMGLDVGALSAGNWSGSHAVGWDYNAPQFGDLRVGESFQKHSYPFGIMVNARGERFVDEGADFRNYTYAKYGQEILKQPYQLAWQVFDSKVTHLLRDEYRIQQVTKVKADTLEGLATKLDSVDPEGFLRTVHEFNDAVRTDIEFNPTVLDGRHTEGLSIRKSNWANPLDTPPFEAYATTCGITFTFGGLGVDPSARVLSAEGWPIPGLFAAGELVGGLFYFNYPGGAGLTSGAVFGRLAGASGASYLGG
jgi:tricarballylate dehydrogenase